LVDQSGKELVLGQSHHKPLAAVVAHRCVEKGSSRCMCYGARYLLGALSFLLFISILILNILDLNSFIVIYCDYRKVEYDSTFSTGSALALPCFCAFPVIATEHPICRFDEEPGI
jgi:hypothetical protein